MLSSGAILRFHVMGDFSPARVAVERVPSTRPVLPDVERLIDSAWDAVQQRPGVHLFDGPMCRLESWRLAGDTLHLALSDTSYKPFLGTNLTHPELADTYGQQALANPVGVSPALLTADAFLVMGRRNRSVAYYPDRVHPFAGSLDPADADVFAAVSRELREELSMSDADVEFIRCTGIAEDLSIRQPELIFFARTLLSRGEVEDRLDATEHHGSWACPALPDAVSRALADAHAGAGEAFTPVAVASLLLFGRIEWGPDWFDATSRPFDTGVN